MELQLKFKEGMIHTRNWKESEGLLTTKENGENILDYLVKGKRNNSPIVLKTSNGQDIVRSFEDLKSIEIIF